MGVVPDKEDNKEEVEDEQQEDEEEKLKVELNFALEQAIKAQRGSRGIALLFL